MSLLRQVFSGRKSNDSYKACRFYSSYEYKPSYERGFSRGGGSYSNNNNSSREESAEGDESQPKTAPTTGYKSYSSGGSYNSSGSGGYSSAYKKPSSYEGSTKSYEGSTKSYEGSTKSYDGPTKSYYSAASGTSSSYPAKTYAKSPYYDDSSYKNGGYKSKYTSFKSSPSEENTEASSSSSGTSKGDFTSYYTKDSSTFGSSQKKGSPMFPFIDELNADYSLKRYLGDQVDSGLSDTTQAALRTAIHNAPEIDAKTVPFVSQALESKYKEILNEVFGLGGWVFVPLGPHSVSNQKISREYALICHGKLLATTRGFCPVIDSPTFDLNYRYDNVKCMAFNRCCKDAGIASELSNPDFLAQMRTKKDDESNDQPLMSL